MRRRSIAILTAILLVMGGVIAVDHVRHAGQRVLAAGGGLDVSKPVGGSQKLITTDPVIVNESHRKGSRAWRLDPGAAGDIEGFADRTSVVGGDTLGVYVRTAAPRYRAEVYRLGWYEGDGGRLYTKIGWTAGDVQHTCQLLQPRLTVSCSNWSKSFELPIGANWLSGAYVIKLIGSDLSESYVPFVVRERVPRAPILVQESVTTWQAYNLYGGHSLYRVDENWPRSMQFADRSRAVSFDRPYAWPGDGQLFRFEFPMISWLESRGYGVAYSTNIDLQEQNDALQARKIMIPVGHDEYYSTQMRTAIEQAIDSGTNLLFAGGNDMYRHIRFEPSLLGPDRIEVNYRLAAQDPFLKTDPQQVTNQWRDPPLSEPEQEIMGAQYGRCGQRSHDWYPTLQPEWLFHDTGFHRGDVVRNILGYEVDFAWPGVPHPQGEVVVAKSPVDCSTTKYANSTIYQSASGAYVFDAGTIWFDCGFGPGCGDLPAPDDAHIPPDPLTHADPRLERLASNLVDAMLHGSVH